MMIRSLLMPFVRRRNLRWQRLGAVRPTQAPLDPLEISPRMDKRQGDGTGLVFPLQLRIAGQARGIEIKEAVLRIPPLNVRLMPEVAAKAINRPVTMASKTLGPIRRPLLVNVVRAALIRDSRRKKNGRCQVNECF